MRQTQKQIAVGSRVMYAAEFLRNTGQFTGRVPFAVGTVESIPGDWSVPYAMVRWDGEAEARVCLIVNLWPADKRHLEPR